MKKIIKAVQNNCAANLRKTAKKFPDKKAFIYPTGKKTHGKTRYNSITFSEFETRTNTYAHAFSRAGITKGTKTVLIQKAGPELYCLLYALFKTGAVPVVIDPGMGLKNTLQCFNSIEPEAFIGIPAAHLVRKFQSKYFKSIRTSITLGKKLFWDGLTIDELYDDSLTEFDIPLTDKNDLLAISFTTGSTGTPKGVEITHGMLNSMMNHFKKHFKFSEDDVDLATLPLLAVVDCGIGVTIVTPQMDPSKPAKADPRKIINNITDNGVTTMFASPALLNVVANYGEKHKIHISSLLRVISGGAPVPVSIINKFKSIINKDALFHVAYGATEGLPISSIESDDMIKAHEKHKGENSGTCIGKPVKGVDVKIIKITEEPVEKLTKKNEAKKLSIGEIIIKGDIVSKAYFQLPEENRLSKIKDKDGIYHRMGDLGWIDEKNRLWFCGRKKQKVTTQDGFLFTVPCEMVFNQHPLVYRSALVGIPDGEFQKPVICIEPVKKLSSNEKNYLKNELLALAKKYEITEKISELLFHNSFPVDIRHNSKIFREKLSQWAEIEFKKNKN